MGIISFVGEVGDAGDAGKALRIADKASDVAKTADKPLHLLCSRKTEKRHFSIRKMSFFS